MKLVNTFKSYLLIAFGVTLFQTANAQLKVGDNPNTINSSAVLEMEANNKGMLLPRVALTSTTNATPLAGHVAGMVVFNTATAGDVKPGLYYNDGTKWSKIDPSASSNSSSNQVISGNPVNAQCLGGFPSTTATGNTAPATYNYGGFTFKKEVVHHFTGNGHSYAVYRNVSGTSINWFTAKDAAANLGGYLATFTGYNEWNTMQQAISQFSWLDNSYMWIGMARYGYGSGWFQDDIAWITCEESDRFYSQGNTTRIVQFSNFGSGQPDNSNGSEGFVHTFGKNNVGVSTPFGPGTPHAWNDLSANFAGVSGFIVEFQQQ